MSDEKQPDSTNDGTPAKASNKADDFAKQSQQASRGVVGEMVDFLLDNKKWWLTPIIVALALIGVLVAVGSVGGAPFIYTLF